MKRILPPLLTLSILALFGLGFAEYNAEDDVTVDLTAPVVSDLADDAGVGALGGTLFAAQEGAHGALTDTTGAEVDHYYLWVCLSPTACVPVDPFKISR